MKPIHIIVDGTDGTGKTTVCQLLSRHFDIPIIKMPIPQDKVRTEIIEPLSEMFNKTLVQFHESSFILDRGYTSSLVYSKVFNREHDLTYIENIEKILQPHVFIITAHDEKLKTLRDDDIYSPHEVEKIDKEFMILADKRGYRVINVNNKTPLDVCNHIIKSINIPEIPPVV